MNSYKMDEIERVVEEANAFTRELVEFCDGKDERVLIASMLNVVGGIARSTTDRAVAPALLYTLESMIRNLKSMAADRVIDHSAERVN